MSPEWRSRVEAIDWDSVHTELDATGCAPIGALLSASEAAAIA